MITEYDSNLAFSKHISWCEINNEIFVFDEQNDHIFLFRTTKREVWKLISQSDTIFSVIRLAQNNYAIDPEKTLAFIQKLHSKGLIEVVRL